MAQIIQFDEQRRTLTAKRAFRRWSSRFHDTFEADTCPRDLNDSTLLELIQPGDQSMKILHEFILAVKGREEENAFNSLSPEEKMTVMDTGLFVLDRLRFECMKRLGWIEGYPASGVALIDLVEGYRETYSKMKHEVPSLSPEHPLYEEYEAAFESDRGAFIRRLIPQALEAFGAK